MTRPVRAAALLLNLGTPDAPTSSAVRRYLREFLSDRRVVEVNPLLWKPILNGPILTFRPRKSAALYRRIWDQERNDSPLRIIAENQARKLRGRFESCGVHVGWAMRYGTPSVAEAMDALIEQGVDRILLLALYPQYSATTTASAYDAAFRHALDVRQQPSLRTCPPYHDDPRYLDAIARSVRHHVRSLEWEPEVLLGSFHGIPRDYADKGDPYPKACEQTWTSLQDELSGLQMEFCRAYQSRFGPQEWLQPYLDHELKRLAADGRRRLVIVAPGFSVDCLETLEELHMGARKTFLEAGGTHFSVVPCLNASDAAIDVYEHLIRRELGGW